jgi:hypothetical protein
VDPEPLASSKQGPTAADAIPVRLLETQARAHIGRRLLHQEVDGELVEDAVWLWSSAPARYLDSALRVTFASSPDVRLVDSGNATAIAVTLIAWHVESADSVRLVGAVELVMTSADRTVQAHVIHGSEPISSELPGNLAAAAGRLLQTLVSDSLMRATQVSRGSAQRGCRAGDSGRLLSTDTPGRWTRIGAPEARALSEGVAPIDAHHWER